MSNKEKEYKLDDSMLSTVRAFTVELEKLYKWVSSNVLECKEKRCALVDFMSAEKWIRKAILSPNHYNYHDDITE